ncbi:fibronectin type III domain-containing protein [Microbacterium sp. HD4P20]|uniref:rhamnogalacturonan lyase family protein n=1 Tax=Microbacterium sp. HD4P20 TaxID=2864874 RepID=UPI0020A2BF37|nr:fibronectin type III domain-containing protein [Microbacterium sp. HD4P20]MCP2635738.1 fibronectin type III domain-containing protein [Microbacterium sp. HD4P20]
MPHSAAHPQSAFTHPASGTPPIARPARRIAAATTAAVVVAALLTATPAAAAAAAIEPGPDGAYRFDFGTGSSPVAEGFTEVSPGTAYDAGAGFGISTTEGLTLISRDRTGSTDPADPLTNDWVGGGTWEFLVDLPNGDYDVTVTSGDQLAGTSTVSTDVTLEGVAAGRISARQEAVTQTFRTSVEDGQLTAGFGGSGIAGLVNGLEIVPFTPAAPADATITRVAWNAVDLSWSVVDGAVTYDVLRADVAEDGAVGAFAPLAQDLTETTHSDTSVVVGGSYAYAIVAVSAYDRVSPQSAPLLSDEIPELTAPDAPADLAVAAVTTDSVTLTWSAVANAETYLIERAPTGTEAFEALATVGTPGHTDAGVDTDQAWTYRVTAANAAGSASATVDAPAYVAPAPLPEGDVVTFDFGPGAVADGALPVVSTTSYLAEWGYGFTTAPTAEAADVDRGTADALRSDFVSVAGATFEADLGAGDYSVQLIAGDEQNPTTTTITAESMAKVQANPQSAGTYLEMAFTVALVDGRLTLQFGGDAASLNALTITRLPERVAGAIPTVYISGDSTVQTYDPIAYAPQAGWGQMIDRFFADDIAFANHAIGGRSSKNFITQGRLDEILRAIRPGDYQLIQFGHNDATQGVDDRYASPADYKEYLRVYVEGTRQRGATPILVTPVSRRSFNPDTGEFNVSFPEYVAKMTELAIEEDVLLVDLSASSRAYLNEIGPDAAKAVFLHVDPGVFPNRPGGTVDDTHFQEYGAIQMARLIAQDVAELADPLAQEVVDIAPPAEVPVAPQNLVAGAISNGGATLQWDASPSADIYKIYRQALADPEPAWALVGMVTQTSSIVQGLAEGTGYRYHVVAVNGRGDSEPSNVVTFNTKQALYKFDMQLAGNPLMAGYTEVTPTMGYDASVGYGWERTGGSGDGRDRGDAGGAANDLVRDFVLPGDSNTFALDVPNGTYSVKTYSGDWIGTTRTNFRVEGREAGTGNAGRGGVNETLRGPFLVTDGQLNVEAYGSAAATRFNGLEVTPILLGPTGLEVTGIDTDPAAPSVSLSWDAVGDVTWNVYRQSPFDAASVLVGSVDAPEYVDTTARVGLDYAYHVTAVDQTDLESVPSDTVEVSFVDEAAAAPSAPVDLSVERIDAREIEIAWAQPVGALYHLVFRSEVEGEQGELVGIAETNRYVDADEVLTTIPYYYTVVAVNAGGAGPASAQLITQAVTVLQRQAEYLDRAPLAVQTDDGILVSWRLLGTDPASVAFHVYRDGERITDEPITGSTNLLDSDGGAESEYFVTKVLAEKETTETEAFGVQSGDYLSLPLQKPADGYTKDGQPYSYSANDVSVGDVDGDGQYEYFVKWYPSNAKDNSQAGYTGNVYLDAYRLDGTRLWRVDLGVNIRAGAHYTQHMVYDFDGDGSSEMIVKTGDGTIDGVGQPIGNASADHRNSSGYVLTGPEYLTVFDGQTGAAIDTIDYTPPRGDVGAWGDGYGNRVDRFLAGVAYLDGEKPSAIFSRGYYTRAVVAAYDFDGENLIERWVIDSTEEGAEGLYGEGYHSLSVADVDGDSKDEVVFGSATIDDDGELLYATGLGHGDAEHVSDLDPSRPGLEIFAAHENMTASGNRGATFRDARTGEILWDIPANVDTGRAASGDIDPRHPGAESWAVGGDAAWNSSEGHLMTAGGERIGDTIPAANFMAWFDGDPLREIVDHAFHDEEYYGTPTVAKWNWETQSSEVILADEGARSNNGTKGTPNVQADLFGDWREEIAWRSADSSELRIYSTTDETEHRIPTLMHDMQYRVAVAWQNTGYNQPPWPSFFIGNDMADAPLPSIAVTGDPSGATDTTAPVVSGMPADGTLLPSTATFTVEVTADDPESGVRTLDIAFDGEPVAPGEAIELDGLVGPHTLSVNAVNHDGLVTQTSVRLLVFDDEGATRAPGRGVLSSTSGWEDGLHDGAFTVSMNLWHGVNGSVFRLYENGTLISTELLDPNSPKAQLSTVNVAGKPNGTYVYTGELINAAGTTATTSVTVRVKDAAPAMPVVSHDNWDKNGDYTVTANLWWGTNGTAYKLYENGVLIDEQALAADSPNAQQATTTVTGRGPGSYTYVAEFTNDAGSTSSKPITVTVR